jgi:hypothetical protein
MLRVTEEDEIRQLINAFFRRCGNPVLVAGQAAARSGEARLFDRAGTWMAADTLQLQRRVLLVIELTGLAAYGKENATKASEYVRSYLFPPPAAITTNCFFPFLPR